MVGEAKILSKYIQALIRREDLSREDASLAMSIIMSSDALESEKAEFLIALQEKGPTAEEISSFALTIRQLARHVDLAGIKKNSILVDTCGTGGGTIETFNISTTTMFILSALGIVVPKHGNRAITSRCGSADVLEKLGININMSSEKISKCLSEIGIAFLFAPLCHGAFKNVQKVRKQIGKPTVFNILGPLVNPAFSYSLKGDFRFIQVLGVNDLSLVEKLSGVLKLLNLYRAMVVHGENEDATLGMDEISTLGDTHISELTEQGEIKNYKINPQEFGIALAKPHDLVGGTVDDNARILVDILSGKENGAKRDIVLVNAAAGLYLAGKAQSLAEGIKLAAVCIDSGEAIKKLELFREYSNKI